MSLNFEWDEEKNEINKKKHKISFETAVHVFDDPDYIEMYEGFAEIWRKLGSDVAGIEQLHTDEHSPAIVRVNATLSSCEKFYEAYGVKEGDGMYVAPKKRVKRW